MRQGKYGLTASRAGYQTSRYEEHDDLFTAIVIGPDLEAEHLRFRLLPDAVISGLVNDEAGEAVSGTEVTLVRQEQSEEPGTFVPIRTTGTDGAGAYEFAHLKPGNYFLAVSGRPWYSFHPQRMRKAGDDFLPEEEQPHSVLDVAYPMTFYPSVTDVDLASPISVKAGDREQANVTMRAMPALQVRIPVGANDPSSTNQRSPQMMIAPTFSQEVFGIEQAFNAAAVNMIRSSGQMYMEINGLAPGQYRMRVPEENGRYGEFVSVMDLSAGRTIDLNSPETGVSVTCKFAMRSGAKLPENLRVTLRSMNGDTRYLGQRVADDGTFVLRHVLPGIYEPLVEASGRHLDITQVEASGAKARNSVIKVGQEPATLLAGLSGTHASLTGFAMGSDKGVGGIMIVLVPHQPDANPDLFRRTQTDSDGHFALSRIIPGDYTLLAIENGWDLQWKNPEVIAPYLAGGVNVNIPDREVAVELQQVISVQPR